jgi:hypothetical protein
MEKGIFKKCTKNWRDKIKPCGYKTWLTKEIISNCDKKCLDSNVTLNQKVWGKPTNSYWTLILVMKIRFYSKTAGLQEFGEYPFPPLYVICKHGKKKINEKIT